MTKTPVPANEQCQGLVWTGGCPGYVQCSRQGTTLEKGKLWCKKHAPSLVRAREAAFMAKWHVKWEAVVKGSRAKAEEIGEKVE